MQTSENSPSNQEWCHPHLFWVDGRTSTAAEVQHAFRENILTSRCKLQWTRLMLLGPPQSQGNCLPSPLAPTTELW
jgi:hypothetical protein